MEAFPQRSDGKASVEDHKGRSDADRASHQESGPALLDHGARGVASGARRPGGEEQLPRLAGDSDRLEDEEADVAHTAQWGAVGPGTKVYWPSPVSSQNRWA